MKMMDGHNEPALPSLAALGKDLLIVSPAEVALSLCRPLCCFLLFWIFALAHYYVLACVSGAGLMFFTYTSTSHDLVHRTLPLPIFLNEFLLSALEAICLRSGHAFRLTHLQHHKRFPHEDDIEGAEAAKGFWPALACGPYHQIRLFFWAWQRGNPTERRWMLGESFLCLFIISTAIYARHSFPALLFYVLMVTLASWLFPLATVWWPHRAEGLTVLQQTRGFRGRLVPRLFFQHTYHLEHHLYPGVPSLRWADLGQRLEPYLLRAGVQFIHLP
jgi:beta-carotene hydroxylase